MTRLRATALLLFLCVGCTPDEPRPARTAAHDYLPQDGGTLVRRLSTDIATLNPVRAGGAHDRYINKYLFTPLLYLDQHLQPVAGLARSWTISPDGLVYRFELDDRATFSDGTPVRASDVVFTLRKIIDPKVEATLVAGEFDHLDLARTRAVNDHTLEVAFRYPLAAQLIRFADVFVLPEHVYAVGDFNNDFNDTAVGSGPYRLLKRAHGKQIIVERRAAYWTTKPHIQTVVFTVIGDHVTAWNALKTGVIDESIITSETWLRERANTTLTRTLTFDRFYTLNYTYIAWNNRAPVLADTRVRRALAMCVPTEAIIRDIYHGTARVVTGPFTLDEYACNPHVQAVKYDPAEAQRILASAGWLDRDGNGVLERGGKTMTFTMVVMAGSAVTTQFAQIVQAEFKKIGVELKVSALDGAALVQQLTAGNYDAAYFAWTLDSDPDPYPLFHSSQFPPRGQNFVFYSNPQADRLMEDARKELDFNARKALYWRIHELLAADQPYAWTVQASVKWARSKRLRGVTVSPGYGLFLWYPGEFSWWLSHDEASPSAAKP